MLLNFFVSVSNFSGQFLFRYFKRIQLYGSLYYRTIFNVKTLHGHWFAQIMKAVYALIKIKNTADRKRSAVLIFFIY